MNKLSRVLSGALIGAFALCTAAPGHAAPLGDAPPGGGAVASAVFHPGATEATVQTVQYRRHIYPHYRGRSFRHRRFIPHHVHPRRVYRPRVYRAPGPIGRPGFAPLPRY